MPEIYETEKLDEALDIIQDENKVKVELEVELKSVDFFSVFRLFFTVATSVRVEKNGRPTTWLRKSDRNPWEFTSRKMRKWISFERILVTSSLRKNSRRKKRKLIFFQHYAVRHFGETLWKSDQRRILLFSSFGRKSTQRNRANRVENKKKTSSRKKFEIFFLSLKKRFSDDLRRFSASRSFSGWKIFLECSPNRLERNSTLDALRHNGQRFGSSARKKTFNFISAEWRRFSLCWRRQIFG